MYLETVPKKVWADADATTPALGWKIPQKPWVGTPRESKGLHSIFINPDSCRVTKTGFARKGIRRWHRWY